MLGGEDDGIWLPSCFRDLRIEPVAADVEVLDLSHY
jgi:hypothetical protein